MHPDDQLIRKIAAKASLYRATHQGNHRTAKGRVAAMVAAARRVGRRFPFATALCCLGLAFVWDFYVSSDPARTGFPHLPTMPFFPALIAAGVLAGTGAAWTVAIGALLLQAIIIPPTWSLAMEWDYVPFFLEYAVMMALTAGCVSIAGGRAAPGLPQASEVQRKRKIVQLAKLYRGPKMTGNAFGVLVLSAACLIPAVYFGGRAQVPHLPLPVTLELLVALVVAGFWGRARWPAPSEPWQEYLIGAALPGATLVLMITATSAEPPVIVPLAPVLSVAIVARIWGGVRGGRVAGAIVAMTALYWGGPRLLALDPQVSIWLTGLLIGAAALGLRRYPRAVPSDEKDRLKRPRRPRPVCRERRLPLSPAAWGPAPAGALHGRSRVARRNWSPLHAGRRAQQFEDQRQPPR